MIEIEEGLVAMLSGTASTLPRLPQPPVFPVIRYQRVYATRQSSVDGSNVGVTEVGMQIDCMAETYAAAKALANSVRTILHTYSGRWGDLTSPETHLTAHFVELQTENDFNEQDGDNITHWVSQRYQIWTNMD